MSAVDYVKLKNLLESGILDLKNLVKKPLDIISSENGLYEIKKEQLISGKSPDSIKIQNATPKVPTTNGVEYIDLPNISGSIKNIVVNGTAVVSQSYPTCYYRLVVKHKEKTEELINFYVFVRQNSGSSAGRQVPINMHFIDSSESDIQERLLNVARQKAGVQLSLSKCAAPAGVYGINIYIYTQSTDVGLIVPKGGILFEDGLSISVSREDSGATQAYNTSVSVIYEEN